VVVAAATPGSALGAGVEGLVLEQPAIPTTSRLARLIRGKEMVNHSILEFGRISPNGTRRVATAAKPDVTDPPRRIEQHIRPEAECL
jgi:hypothetical protein